MSCERDVPSLFQVSVRRRPSTMTPHARRRPLPSKRVLGNKTRRSGAISNESQNMNIATHPMLVPSKTPFKSPNSCLIQRNNSIPDAGFARAGCEPFPVRFDRRDGSLHPASIQAKRR
jgi:hypothetical protein